jgi:hypothetical protein
MPNRVQRVTGGSAISGVPEDQTDRIPPESFLPSVMTADVEQHGWPSSRISPRTPDLADPTPDWATLQAAIAGELVLAGSLKYEPVNMPFNAPFRDVRPQAIVRCAAPVDVSETLSLLGQHGVESATRSAGHCFAGHSSTRGVVIDVTPMDWVTVSGGVPTVRAGARLGALYDTLQQQGMTGTPVTATRTAAVTPTQRLPKRADRSVRSRPPVLTIPPGRQCLLPALLAHGSSPRRAVARVSRVCQRRSSV